MFNQSYHQPPRISQPRSELVSRCRATPIRQPVATSRRVSQSVVPLPQVIQTITTTASVIFSTQSHSANHKLSAGRRSPYQISRRGYHDYDAVRITVNDEVDPHRYREIRENVIFMSVGRGARQNPLRHIMRMGCTAIKKLNGDSKI